MLTILSGFEYGSIFDSDQNLSGYSSTYISLSPYTMDSPIHIVHFLACATHQLVEEGILVIVRGLEGERRGHVVLL